MNVGIVCEGRTDFILLEQVVIGVFGPSEVRPLQPVRDELDPAKWRAAGWTLVKSWCEDRGAEGIADEMEIGDLDVIVVQVDGDLCGQQGLPPTRPGLCEHIRTAWIGTATPPLGVVVCIPAQSTDTWLVAALEDTEGGPDGPTLEADRDPLARLASPAVTKNQHIYREKAVALRERLSVLRLSELDRFVGKLRAFLQVRGAS